MRVKSALAILDRKTRVAGAALALAATLAGAGAQATTEERLVYDLYLGGLKGAELAFEARLDGAAYAARGEFRTAGLVGAVYDAFFIAESEGALSPDGVLLPARFRAESGLGSDDRVVEMPFQGPAPEAVRADPPFDPKPWQVDPRAMTGAQDPVTAALGALLPAARLGALCGRSFDVFDGRKRYTVSLDAARPDGPSGEKVCEGSYVRTAGFKPKMMARGAFPFRLWTRPHPSGGDRIWKVHGETSFGIAAAVLRD